MSEDQQRELDPADSLGWMGNPELYRAARETLDVVVQEEHRELGDTRGAQRAQAVALISEQDNRAANMRARRMSYTKIGEVLGMSPAAARRSAQRGIAAAVDTTSVLEQRELALLHFDQMTEVVWEVLRANHFAISNGKVVRLKNEPLRDSRPILEAVDRLLTIERDRAMITGVRAPKQHQVMITHDSADAAIAALEAKIARARAESDLGGGFGGRGAVVEAEVLEEPPGAGGDPGEGATPDLPDRPGGLDHDED